MKTQFLSHRRGFTLVEMLAVITIIVILAALTIGGMGFVNDKQARDKAKIQINLLSSSLDEYKLDRGTFPTEATGAKGDTNILYKALYWDSDEDGSGADADNDQKIYISELNPKVNKQGWSEGDGANARILDPWGNEYYFRSGKNAQGDPNPQAVNPEFDLWSAGPDGKTSASGDTPNTKDDIRNF